MTNRAGDRAQAILHVPAKLTAWVASAAAVVADATPVLAAAAAASRISPTPLPTPAPPDSALGTRDGGRPRPTVPAMATPTGGAYPPTRGAPSITPPGRDSSPPRMVAVPGAGMAGGRGPLGTGGGTTGAEVGEVAGAVLGSPSPALASVIAGRSWSVRSLRPFALSRAS
jgi:hypothetical protein